MTAQWIFLYYILLLTTTALQADPTLKPQIHKWVDESGTIHYSDRSPASPVSRAKTLSLQVPPVQSPNSDYYSAINQMKRITEVKRAREQIKPAKKVILLQVSRGSGHVENKSEKIYNYTPYYHTGTLFIPHTRRNQIHSTHHLKRHISHKRRPSNHHHYKQYRQHYSAGHRSNFNKFNSLE